MIENKGTENRKSRLSWLNNEKETDLAITYQTVLEFVGSSVVILFDVDLYIILRFSQFCYCFKQILISKTDHIMLFHIISCIYICWPCD